MEKRVCKVIAIEHLTLDGVYQGPAQKNEDTRGNFQLGGWSSLGDEPKLREAVGHYMSQGWSMLSGRITYEDIYKAWAIKQPGEQMAKSLTAVEKFVASYDPYYSPKWENSKLLNDVLNQVKQLKTSHEHNLIIFGSGELLSSLMEADLVDEFLLMVHPVILGQGKKLFDDSFTHTRLNLINSFTTPKGVVVSTYQPNKNAI